MWLYFQGLESSDLPVNSAGFDALFDVEFDELRRRVRTGTAAWLESGFFQLNELYLLQSQLGGDQELPVFGGRHIPDPAGGPGHVALDPSEVARTAAYLGGVSFPDRWQEWQQLPLSESDEELRERLAQYHEDLQALYASSAERGWAVVKHFSF
ncbi:hypothetical protein GAR05_00673 [Micromonospora saelicesensis]|uniref:DUF1877 family protein n=1 Tax=Micromonospora saelicesensis TaxID=285676 RepID=A0ABX9CQB3_9ACTN|nr:hypothetical protein [Micromonospora saelicesensis]RAO03693.1 hypothetical protein GAR05_00673 [Micromonospora saelicesensis]